MNRDRLGPTECQMAALNVPRKPVRFAGYDETEKSWW
jgi:hypothetical protein